ncbi:uncharacterized protein LOC143482355 [Brachyhypopomus gauderio]|uniref:uncharacterized protein LOC143482355 n=1 Tax=Brachyhypopomus gauderio TaxID=698409 RepID=UPI004041CF50
MGRLKRYTQPRKVVVADSKGKRSIPACGSRGRRCVTPMRISHLKSHLHKKRWSKCPGRALSPVSEGDFSQGSILKPDFGTCFEGQSTSQIHSKSIVTTGIKDSCQDSTSMILPSGVSSFLMECLDLDSESEETLPSIETLRKAETNEGTGWISDEETLQSHIKNSTLLDLSHAVDIAKQRSPNLSSILELSPVTDRLATEESFSLSPPQPVSPVGFSPLAGPSNTLGSSKNTPEREIKPVVFEETCPVTLRTPLLPPAVKKKRHVCKLRGNTVSRVRKELIPLEPPSEPARFFDFADESDKEAFFQRLKRTFTFQFPAKLITFTDLPVTEDT